MGIITKVGVALQELFGTLAEEAAAVSGVINRHRKFTAGSLARTFVLGFLRNPAASDAALARMAVQAGVAVTPQAIEQRHSPQLVQFFKELFTRATKLLVGSQKALAPLLERFTRVIVLDSSTLRLPDSEHADYPGCGGSHGGGQAALKLQTEWDLRSGALTEVDVEPGRVPDGASRRQQAHYGPGSLRIADLGYFSVPLFAAMAAAGEYFLSRLQFPTAVFLPGGRAVELLTWLAQQGGRFVDQAVELSHGEHLPCRLLAWRLPEEQANRRRQKLRDELRQKSGKEPTAARLDWCAWTILVTNVPLELMTPEEAVILYRARWQVEMFHPDYPSSFRLYSTAWAA